MENQSPRPADDPFILELIRREASIRGELESLYRDLEVLQARIREREAMHGHIVALIPREPPVQDANVNRDNWSELTVPEAALRLLGETRKPMHAEEIRSELESRGMSFSEKDPKATVVTALLRLSHRSLVRRVAPNVFALATERRVS